MTKIYPIPLLWHIFYTFLFSLIVLPAKSQHTESYQYPPSQLITIRSQLLNEDRQVYVHIPKLDSADLKKPLPVLYVLDGDNHFGLLAQYAQYLSRTDVQAMHKTIIVGITNTNRTRDLTPSHSLLDYEGKPNTDAYKLSGGNDIFLQFLDKELIPYINKNYQTSPYRIFAGHSFGGIAVINCLLNYPHMFDAYVAVSPSFWWDNQYLLKLAAKKLEFGSQLNKTLFYSDGNEGGPDSFFHRDLLKFNAIIKQKELKKLKYLYKHYPNETHMTEPVVAYFDALRFIFK